MPKPSKIQKVESEGKQTKVMKKKAEPDYSDEEEEKNPQVYDDDEADEEEEVKPVKKVQKKQPESKHQTSVKPVVNNSKKPAVSSSEEEEEDEKEDEEEEEEQSGKQIAEENEEESEDGEEDKEETSKKKKGDVNNTEKKFDKFNGNKKTEQVYGNGDSEDRSARTLFVGRLPDSANEDTIQELFSPFGEIEDVRFIYKNPERTMHKGCCFVQFSTVESATNAQQEVNGRELDGNTLNVDLSKGSSSSFGGNKGSTGGSDRKSSIFIGNLSWQTTEDGLKKVFSECGEIVRVKLLLNEQGQSRGIAFIDFADKSGVDESLKFNNTDLDGRTIRIEESGNRPPQQKRSRGEYEQRGNDRGFGNNNYRGGNNFRGGGGGRGRGRGGFRKNF
jgi:nucleolin